MIEKFIKKYQSFPLALKAAFWFTICSILQRGIQFIILPLYTRILSTTEYGYYSIFMSWTEIVRIFCTLNLFYNSYNVGMTKFEKDKDRFTSALLGLCYILTFSFLGIYFLLKDIFCSFFGMTNVLVLLILLYIFVESSYQFWVAKQRYEYKYRFIIFSTIFLSIGTPILALFSIQYMQDKSLAVIGSKVIIELFMGIIASIYIVKNGKTLYDSFYWKYGLKSNVPLVPYYLSQIILNHSDRLMINGFCGASQAGIYSVAYSAAMVLTIINTSINSSIIPWMFKKLKKSDFSGIYEITFSLMLLVMGLNLFLIALAPEAMYILASKEYHEAILIIPPVACSTFLLFVSQQFINIEFYYEENKFAAYSSIGVAALNLLLNYIFIPIYGYIIAGYTTLVSYIIFTIIHYIVMRYVCKKHINNKIIWKPIPIIALILFMLITSITLLNIYNLCIIRYALVLLVAGFCIIKRQYIINLIKGKY